MANNQISRLLEFANFQMASEAFLLRAGDQGIAPNESDVAARVITGNRHASVFTATQADDFVTKYQVLAQYRNDPQQVDGTGFSGTLFKNRLTGELTLSF